MHFIKNTILLGLILVVVFPTLAQEEFNDYTFGKGFNDIVLALNRLEVKQPKNINPAQNMFEGLGYAKSATMFKSTDLENSDKVVWSKLANAARLNANYKEAAYWYSKVVQDGPLPKDLLHYAQALQANGNCEEAVTWFKKYNASPAVNKVSFINNCSELNDFRVFDQVDFTNLEGLNSKHLDFSAQPFGNGIVFTSNRGSNKFLSLVDNWTSNNFTDLFYAEKNEGGFGKPKALKGAVNGKFHDGVATFAKEDAQMFFTRNNPSSNTNNEVKNLKIFSVKNNSNIVWSDAIELPFNSDDFSSCHPTLSNDGKTLYFSSDRPGGFGGMDIYMVSMTDGAWGEPKNVGPTVNTAGNEIFPFVTEQEDLAFSSNGHPGFGGLDVYVARQTNPNTNNWDKIVNAGKPFNSTQDDFGFYMNEDNTNGYMSSSRIGLVGNDDIFEWNSDEFVDFFPIVSREQTFCLVEKGTKTPVRNATLDITQTEKGDTEKVTLNTDQNGQFLVTVWPDTKLVMDIAKDGFDNANETWTSMMDEPESNCTYVEIKKIDTFTMNGKVINGSNKKPLHNAKVTILNKCDGTKNEIKSDRNGKFEVKVPCGCDYEVLGEKVKFVNDNKVLKTKSTDCNTAKDLTLSLASTVKTVPKKIVPVFKKNILNVGTIIPLNNINYNYNKATIRDDAAVELDTVVSLLNKYPNLSLEMRSHTDSRGSDEYNLSLSQKRAKSAHKYLVDKGIDPSRITFKGFGETELKNQCANGTKCDDSLHEENRRTEFKVLNY